MLHFLPLHSIEYLRCVSGCRTVPVEVGSRYTDESWSQTLLTVNEFIDRYILNEVSASSSSLVVSLLTRTKDRQRKTSCFLVTFTYFSAWIKILQDGGKDLGYLAQHQLFDQVGLFVF